MINSNEKSLQINKNVIFTRIIYFFKSLFCKNKTDYVAFNNKSENTPNNDNKKFLKTVNSNEDPDFIELQKIQQQLEIIGINEANVLKLTKHLSNEQKQKLEILYKYQIKEYELAMTKHKEKIISIKEKLKA